MKSAKKLERLFSDAAVTIESSPDEAVFQAIKAAYTDTAKERGAHSEPSLWRAIMKGRTTQLATAALIVIAAVLIIQQLGGSVDGTTVAWSDVREAFLDRPWVHVEYDNGAEEWYDLKTGDHFFKDWDGRCVAVDRAANLRRSYYPTGSKHIREDRPVVYRDGVVPPWQPKTAWETIVGRWEQMAADGSTGTWEVETAIDETEDQRRVRFDCYFNDAAGRRLLVRQIWADPQTRLPLRVWKRLDLASREEQQCKAIAGTFDFPDSGPQSIYDLGVARDLPVVKNYDKKPLASVEQAIDGAKEALKRFPSRYRAVVWSNERASEIDVIWRDGQRIRHNRYFNLPPDSTSGGSEQYYLRLPATAHEALEWAKTQTPISTHMFDGQKEYTRYYSHPEVSNTSDEVRVTRARDSFFMPNSCKPIEQQWPWEKRNPASFELIDDAPETLRGYVGLRKGGGSTRYEHYLDPEHDYICVHIIWWKRRADRWEKEREYVYSDLTRLPTGQWYARTRKGVTYADHEQGTSRHEAIGNIHVELLEEGDFPPDTFAGQKLMEGAKVETY